MKCRFNSKLDCRKMEKNCLLCDTRNIKTLDGIDIIDGNTKYVCPYCLYRDKLDGFFVYNKENKILKIKQCPSCFNKTLEYTLVCVGRFTPRELAVWIYQYPFWEFKKRCYLEKFNSNLVKLKIYEEFWDNYNDIKEKVIVKNVK